ncbi:glutathione S-transferase family protein [Pseudomonas oryzihabitans]|uniref:Glutathione S-transferase n=1 Tax=Pseudomonas oryzihabitans TaxID=47885 RepID=A0AAJ2BKE5_9PSED|nr:glutathione S-transferase family protein [Pseudomonas psychrotolerans]MDR6235984.1 glutathione S-transferase [Pseudomonas psychrotolerans]MDR6354708.1 glutathione S-transferase [Pseudomonas psychrotolerans]
MLKILGRISSINVRKVLWCCDELGLAYEREDWGAGFRSAQSAEYLQWNPNGQIPVLLDGDFVLWESNSILRYLANAHGGEALYPQEAQIRARVDQWLDWQASELNPAWSYAYLALVKQQPPEPDPQRLAEGVTAWNGRVAVLEAHLTQHGPYVAGATFSLADIVLGLSLHRWRSTPMERIAAPAIEAYLDRLATHPAWACYASDATP